MGNATSRQADTPGELLTTTQYDADGNPTGYTVDHADDLIRVAPEYLALGDLPIEQGCVTFTALNGTWRYRFAGVDRRCLLFEKVDA
jgi:hypothetical protein